MVLYIKHTIYVVVPYQPKDSDSSHLLLAQLIFHEMTGFPETNETMFPSQ